MAVTKRASKKAPTPQEVAIDNMKRVQLILRMCENNPKLKKEVANQTSSWVRTGKQSAFSDFLTEVEKKLNIIKH